MQQAHLSNKNPDLIIHDHLNIISFKSEHGIFTIVNPDGYIVYIDGNAKSDARRCSIVINSDGVFLYNGDNIHYTINLCKIKTNFSIERLYLLIKRGFLTEESANRLYTVPDEYEEW